MKKNGILIVLLMGLIVFAYYFEELGEHRGRLAYDAKHRIVNADFKNIDAILLSKVKLLKIDGRWMVGDLDYPASNTLIDKLFNHLKSIHLVKALNEKDEDQFFARQSHFITLSALGKNWKYRLGDVSEVTGNFYFQDLNGSERVTYLARDISEFSGFYKTELELDLGKYLALKDLIAGGPENFVNANLFRHFVTEQIKSIKINNKWNRWYEVDFENKMTTPSIPKGLRYKNLNNMLKEFVALGKIKRLISNVGHKLDLDLCEVEVVGNDKIVYRVYGELDGEKGIYVTTENDPKWIFEMDQKSREIFFSNVQIFWNKRIFHKEDLLDLKSFDFKLGDQKSLYKFQVTDIESFQIKNDDSRIEKLHVGNFNMLFNLIFSLTKFNQAKQVLFELPEEIQPRFQLAMELLKKELLLHFYDSKILIENKTDGYTLEYLFPVADYKYNSLYDFFALK